MVTEEQLRARLALEAGQEGPTAVAKRYGVQPATMTHVLSGHRGIPPSLARAMGFDKVVRFVPSAGR